VASGLRGLASGQQALCVSDLVNLGDMVPPLTNVESEAGEVGF
jgi:hypothetical protein